LNKIGTTILENVSDNGLGNSGDDMAKRAKVREVKTATLPMAGKVATVLLAVAALGFGLLSHPATVHPLRSIPERQAVVPPPAAPVRQVENQETADLPGRFVRQIVDYDSRESPGTLVVDTKNTFLYLVLGGGKAMRYGIGVGREGFGWSGIQSVAKKVEWPDWRPPAEMLSRQPYLPRFMAGGPGNPLGARAMYLGETEYRIHGTNKPETIGKRVSSGCIRLTNDDITDLYLRVKMGAKVIVLPPAQNNPASAEERRTDRHYT
jgi:lipoprotein-anchoring transpeptidase ErfK/SrfK